MENFAKFFSEQQKLSFEFHDELNSKFWKNEKMLPQVRRHLLMIAEKWAKFSKIPPKAVEDVVLTGGNANYNYTSQSDLDLHLILDFSKVKECKDQSDDFINEYLKEKKTVWEMTHNITIYGVSVELYGEPKGQPKKQYQGVFSVKDDKWLQKPVKKEVDLNDPLLLSKISHYQHMINHALEHHATDASFLKKIKKKLNIMRGAGIKRAGEYSIENLAFKELRNRGVLDKLKKHINKIQDKTLSL